MAALPPRDVQELRSELTWPVIISIQEHQDQFDVVALEGRKFQIGEVDCFQQLSGLDDRMPRPSNGQHMREVTAKQLSPDSRYKRPHRRLLFTMSFDDRSNRDPIHAVTGVAKRSRCCKSSKPASSGWSWSMRSSSPGE